MYNSGQNERKNTEILFGYVTRKEESQAIIMVMKIHARGKGG